MGRRCPLNRVNSILLNGKEYRARLGRGWYEKGSLPRADFVSADLLHAGLFQGFETKIVPILADEYWTTDEHEHITTEKVKKGHYITGVLMKLLNEKRVYVVAKPVQGDKGFSFCLRLRGFRRLSVD